MTPSVRAGKTDSRPTAPAPAPDAASSSGSLRIAVIDTDTGFLQVLGKRLERLGWEHRVLASPVPVEATRRDAPRRDRHRPRRARAAGLGATSSASASALPGLGIVVCTGTSTVAQRVRGLRMGADDWLTKPCHPEELIARVEAVVRRRRRADTRGEDGPVVAGELEIRADRFQAFVDGESVDLTRREFELDRAAGQRRGPRARARGDLPPRVGLRRWPAATARSTSSCASCARSSRRRHPSWKLHPHALRRRLPLRGRIEARRGRRPERRALVSACRLGRRRSGPGPEAASRRRVRRPRPLGAAPPDPPSSDPAARR